MQTGGKQAGDVGAKAAAPLKSADEKKAALAKAEADLNGAKQKQAEAAKLDAAIAANLRGLGYGS